MNLWKLYSNLTDVELSMNLLIINLLISEFLGNIILGEHINVYFLMTY